MAISTKLASQESWAQRSVATKPATEKNAAASGPLNIITHFPPLPITKKQPAVVLREASPTPSFVSSNSEESVCSVKSNGSPLHLNLLLQNHTDFEVKMTIQQDTTCFLFCDARVNNVETQLYKGMEVVVKDVLEFPDVKQNWYNIVKPFFGWVDGEALKRKKTVKKQMKKRKMKAVAKPVEVAEAEKFPFEFGETVKCLLNEHNHYNFWKIGTIETTSVPVKVKFEGNKCATIIEISNIRKVKSKQSFVVIVEDLCVRALPNSKSFVSAHLKKGTKIEVVEFRGQYAKLNNPIGWIRCRNGYQLSILESNYHPESVQPTLRIKNLPEEVEAESVVECLKTQLGKKAHSFYFVGVNVNFTAAKNERKTATIVLPDRYKATTIVQHALAEGFTLSGEKLDVAFHLSYLRSISCPKEWRAERC